MKEPHKDETHARTHTQSLNSAFETILEPYTSHLLHYQQAGFTLYDMYQALTIMESCQPLHKTQRRASFRSKTGTLFPSFHRKTSRVLKTRRAVSWLALSSMCYGDEVFMRGERKSKQAGTQSDVHMCTCLVNACSSQGLRAAVLRPAINYLLAEGNLLCGDLEKLGSIGVCQCIHIN